MKLHTHPVSEKWRTAVAARWTIKKRAEHGKTMSALWTPEMRARQAEKTKASWNPARIADMRSKQHAARSRGAALSWKNPAVRSSRSAGISAAKRASFSGPRGEELRAQCRRGGIKAKLLLARRGTVCPEHYIRGWLDSVGIEYVYQFPVEDFLVDFYIPSMRLILEYDGSWWHRDSVIAADASRTEKLERLGYKVVRSTETTLASVLRENFRSREVLL